MRASFLTLCAMCAALILIAAVTVSHFNREITWLSSRYVALGGCAIVLSILLNSLVVTLLSNTSSPASGAIPIILALFKYPALLLLIYVVSLRGSGPLLSFLLGFMSFIPASAFALRTQKSGS